MLFDTAFQADPTLFRQDHESKKQLLDAIDNQLHLLRPYPKLSKSIFEGKNLPQELQGINELPSEEDEMSIRRKTL